MKHTLLGAAALLSCALFVCSCASNQSQTTSKPLVSTIAESFGDGQKVSAVILEYAKEIDTSSVTFETYSVEGRKIEALDFEGNTVKIRLVYENKWDKTDGKMPPREKKEAGNAKEGNGPRFEDDGAPVDLSAKVVQKADIKATDGTVFKASAEAFVSTSAKELVIEDFAKKTFTDSETGITLPYFVYLPEEYNDEEKYPLVFFVPDASADTSIDTATLTQGNGGTIWASEDEQIKHKAIVVAVQYPLDVVKKIRRAHDRRIRLDGRTDGGGQPSAQRHQDLRRRRKTHLRHGTVAGLHDEHCAF